MITLVSIDGQTCVVTQFSYTNDRNTQKMDGVPVVTATQISGEFLVFAQPEIPTMYDEDGVPSLSKIEFVDGNRAVSFDNVLFSEREKLPFYEKCDAAHVEFVAENMSTSEITKHINSSVVIN